MNKNNELEFQIDVKAVELEKARERIQKYAAIVPLHLISEPVVHCAIEMKRDFDDFNQVYKDYMSLLHQRRAIK